MQESSNFKFSCYRCTWDPLKYTDEIRRVFVMSVSGSASRTMKSALFPPSIVPASAILRNSAEVRVEATITCAGVIPAATMAAQADCSTMKPGQKLNRGITDSSSKSYGQYYATGFHLKKAVEEPGVLWIVWAKENDQWKIVAYHILTP